MEGNGRDEEEGVRKHVKREKRAGFKFENATDDKIRGRKRNASCNTSA